MRLSDAERKEIEASFEAAQARTSAPVGCVFASASGDYAIPPLALERAGDPGCALGR